MCPGHTTFDQSAEILSSENGVRPLKARHRPQRRASAILSWMTAKPTPVDPVEEAFLNAPEGDPLTDEERRLLAEAREEFARTGKTYSSAEVKQAIAEMRRRQEGE